jgi:hypothetical protein
MARAARQASVCSVVDFAAQAPYRQGQSASSFIAMLKRLRPFDLNLILVLLIVVIAALPLLTRSGLPRHTDLELHVLRAAEYGEVWRAGVLYPRWAPNFYYGYGYPIFNYYAPFTYALANVYALVPGVDVVTAVKGVMLTAFLLAAYGAYFLARRHFGSKAGVIAAAAFVLSPYFVFIEPFMRGDLAEFFALSLLPWVLLVFDRPRFSLTQPFVLAILIFSHNLLALMGVGFLIAYLLWRGLVMDRPRRWRGDAVSIGLALALTAILWLPFFAERGAVRLDVAGPGHFDYHNHFVPWSMLLSPSPALDFGATALKYIYNLGLIQWLMLIPAAIAAAIKRREEAGKHALFYVWMSALLIFLITPASTIIWDAVPPAALIQFPWRFLGPAALALAMAAGAAVSGVDRGRSRRVDPSSPFTRYLLLVLLFALLMTSLPTLYPPSWDAEFGDTSPRGAIEFELSGVARGTTSTDDFLPVPVGRVPPPNEALLASYDSPLIDKLDRSSLPAGSRARVEAHSAIYDRFQVEATSAFTARVLTFVFPGWRAYVDGHEVSIGPEDQSGLMLIPVPTGSHVIEVTLQLTTPQLIGTLISIGAVGLIGALAVKRRRLITSGEVSPSFRPAVAWPLLVSVLFFLVIKIAVIDQCETCFRYTSPPGQVLGAQYQQLAHLGGHIDLLGYDLPVTEVAAGGTLPVTLYWRATAPVPENYQVFVHVGVPGVEPVGQSDKLNPGDFPTTRWPLDKYVWDDHRVTIKPDTPPGDYRLIVGLYTLGDGRRAPVLDDQGQVTGDAVLLTAPVHVK